MYRFIDRKMLIAIQSLAEGFAFHIRHHVVKQSIRIAGIEQRQDVRMVQPRGELDLPQESIGPERSRQIRMQHLERDDALVLPVLREIDGRHAATAKLTVY